MLTGIANKVLEVAKKYPRKEVEIEVRFGQGEFNRGVSCRSYNRLVTEIRRSKLFSEVSEEISTVKIYDDGIRSISILDDEGNTVVNWENKEVIESFSIKPYGLKIIVSRESPTSRIYQEPKLIRERKRKTFQNDITKIDLSEIITKEDGKIQIAYEIEVEYIENNIDNFHTNFESYVQLITKWLRGTNIIYKNSEIYDLRNYFAKILNGMDSKMLPKMINLMKSDFVYGGVVGNEKTDYWVTYKADGIRKLLAVDSTGIWLFYPNDEFNLVHRWTSKQLIPHCLLDGELIQSKNSVYNFQAFDCLVAGQNDFRDLPYGPSAKHPKNYRLRALEIFVGKIKALSLDSLFIEVKESHQLNLDNFYDTINMMLDKIEKGQLDYQEDGLVFFPGQMPYFLKLSYSPLTSTPGYRKWKRVRDLTIDFVIDFKFNGDIDLLSYDTDYCKMVPFRGTKKNAFTPDMIDQTHKFDRNRDNIVAEFEWVNGKMAFRKFRDDKSGANSLAVAKRIFDDIHSPIEELYLRGKSHRMVSYYHNRIKEQLINENVSNSIVLDIGSGRGGDLTKYQHRVKYLYAVEPNKDNLQELERRLDGLPNLKSKTSVINVGGEENIKITNVIREKYQKVDIISFMLSLSFFWSSTYHLDALVQTIITNLKPGGKIVFLTVNGESLLEVLKDKNSIDLNGIQYYLLPPFKPPFGHPVDLIYPDVSIVGKQREYLVFLDDLTNRLKNYGIELKYIEKADKNPMLVGNNRTLSSIYSYGVYQSVNPELLPNISVPIDISLPQEVPVFKSEVETQVETQVETSQEFVTSNTDELPMLNVKDSHESLKCSWYDNLVRIQALGDGSCFIHSVLKAFYPKYQNDANSSHRASYAAYFRRDLALMLTTENPKYPGYNYWQTIGKGALPNILMQEIKDPSLIEIYDNVEYTITGLQRLLNSNKFLGNEIYSLVSEVLDLDIYILQAKTDDLYYNSDTTNLVDRNAVVISGNGYHFEVVAVDNGKYFQTIFGPDDPFISTIKQKFSISEKVKYDPDETFIKNFVETFTDYNLGKLEIPPIEKLFNPKDTFRVWCERLKPEILAYFPIRFPEYAINQIVTVLPINRIDEVSKILINSSDKGLTREVISSLKNQKDKELLLNAYDKLIM